jgi:predicted aspartyl protease
MKPNRRCSYKYTPKTDLPHQPLLKASIENMANSNLREDITFLIDTGADLTHIGHEYIIPLNLQLQGKPYKYFDIDRNLHENYVTWVNVEIAELGFKKSIKAVISNNEGSNFLGRNFLNSLNIFLLGKNSRFILHT